MKVPSNNIYLLFYNQKVRWITETAVMLALLVTLQRLGSFIPEQMTKQLITCTMVNCVLAIIPVLRKALYK